MWQRLGKPMTRADMVRQMSYRVREFPGTCQWQPDFPSRPISGNDSKYCNIVRKEMSEGTRIRRDDMEVDDTASFAAARLRRGRVRRRLPFRYPSLQRFLRERWGFGQAKEHHGHSMNLDSGICMPQSVEGSAKPMLEVLSANRSLTNNICAMGCTHTQESHSFVASLTIAQLCVAPRVLSVNSASCLHSLRSAAHGHVILLTVCTACRQHNVSVCNLQP